MTSELRGFEQALISLDVTRQMVETEIVSLGAGEV